MSLVPVRRTVGSTFPSLDDRVSDCIERAIGAFREPGVEIAVFSAGATTVASDFTLARRRGGLFE